MGSDGPAALLAAPCPGTSDAGPRADGGPGAGYVSEIQQSVPGKFAGALAPCHGPGAGDGPPSRAECRLAANRWLYGIADGHLRLHVHPIQEEEP